MKEFSCEHCGRSETRQAERQCDHCGEGMCADCLYLHDAYERCPKEFPSDRLDPNYPENYGFQARFRHANGNGEEYWILFKGVTEICEAAEYARREEQAHKSKCAGLYRWKRYADRYKIRCPLHGTRPLSFDEFIEQSKKLPNPLWKCPLCGTLSALEPVRS